MIRFENIEFLWGLLGILLFLFIYLWVSRWKKKSLALLGDKKVVLQMIPYISLRKPTLKFTLFILAYTFLIIGIADPQIGQKSEEVKNSGSDIMILLDVSNSMLAQDMVPNRLDNAKQGIANLIDHLHNDRIGIVIFAGQAYVQLPMTTDYAAAKLFLNTINTNIVPVQGTAIGAAIGMGLNAFDFKDGLNKAMILMTDGENHEDDAVNAATYARNHKVDIHVIGLGSEQGAPIPILKDGKASGFIVDSSGQTVISKMNETICREIASAGGGVYLRATNTESGLSILVDKIASMKKTQYSNHIYKDYEDRFQLFFILTFLALVIDFLIGSKKNVKLAQLNLFESKKETSS